MSLEQVCSSTPGALRHCRPTVARKQGVSASRRPLPFSALRRREHSSVFSVPGVADCHAVCGVVPDWLRPACREKSPLHKACRWSSRLVDSLVTVYAWLSAELATLLPSRNAGASDGGGRNDAVGEGPVVPAGRNGGSPDTRRWACGSGKLAPARLARLVHVSENYRTRLALTVWLAAAAAGCGIPIEPAAPANLDLKVEAGHVSIAWETVPRSWLSLRRYEWRLLTGDGADQRLACPEAGDEEFCYLRPMLDPQIELPRAEGAEAVSSEVTVEVRAVYQSIQAHTGEFRPPRYSTTERVTRHTGSRAD